jgi:serine/threonine protein kinase
VAEDAGSQSGKADPSADAAASSISIPGYEEPTEIGQGGFGVVYRAWQPELRRFVAIKVLTGLRDAQTRRRFDRERESVGSLSGHPNIVTIYASGFTADGSPYLVMEYLSGGSLADRLEHGAVPWPEAAEIGAKLASAVQAAHAAGVLHRDIKPENVLLSERGEPKLADFGIAVLQGATATRNSFTPAHAAPEVLGGKPADEASDVYSLASTIYALIAGRPAFVRDTDDSLLPLMGRVMNEPVPDLRARGAPDAVCAALEGAMTKDPTARVGSAAAFGGLLQAIGSGAVRDAQDARKVTRDMPESLSVMAGADEQVAADRRPRRRRLSHPLRWLAMLAAALVLVLGVAGALTLTGSSPKQSPSPVTLPNTDKAAAQDVD